MAHNSSPLGEVVRAHRRTAGMSQERLAEESGLSVGTIRKIEQGGQARVDTLHQIARVLGIETSALFAPGAPLPVGEDGTNRQLLAQLRQALMPPVGISSETLADPGQAEDLSYIRRRIEDSLELYNADRYESVARQLPALLRTAEAATVAAGEEEAYREAVLVRAHALLLAGKYLTQVRQYDMAYQALVDGIRLAREQDATLTAATGVTGLCWLFLRQDRFDEAAHLAATTAEQIEPRFSTAAPGQLAAWGELCLRIASAAVRNNRPDDAAEARRMAATAASAVGHEHADYRTHWARFGPVTAELKVVEDLSLTGDAHGVLRRADDGLLSRRALRKVGRPSNINWNRHRLEVARAHVALGSTQDAMDELARVRSTTGAWMQHQPMARYVMTDILKTRKRTLTRQMREMATHLDVHA
ncbi:helix-turn-helix domain-containing protein [Streptomyces sp. Amel2xC10]|uniref:helix-turn-helix domain-containing protein n=1 Tax=Streptomyces sp. Amel2xC10 TaxID=1305826 RepID=UPI000A08411D|nr:helix-turn-helix transcriptional regulator [Streptomyces sp. Amel2xC10]SMF59163.1 Transcriptional regulator, contains XRE-family HTH domain [Streptomyces sp. Amel2xC10]